MINRRLFTAATAAVLFSCFISAALSACGNGNSYSDMRESDSYHILEHYGEGTTESSVTVPATDSQTTEGTAAPTVVGDCTENDSSDTSTNNTDEYVTNSSAPASGEASSSEPPDKKTDVSDHTSASEKGTTEAPETSGTEGESGTGDGEKQSSEAFQVQNPVQPIDHSVEFFFKVPGYTGKSYYDLYLNDGFVPVDSAEKLREYCRDELLTLEHGNKSVNYIITPQGLFDDMVAGLVERDERASESKSIKDIYERDIYLYDRLGLDYQTYYSRGMAIFKIKKMGDVGSKKHSIYAIYYYSYEDAQQADLVDDIVRRATAGFDGSDYDKLLSAYDYLCGKAVYNNDADSYEAHSAYGALVSGKAVCEGYAKAYKQLLDNMGILNYIAINSTHAWNVVMYKGEWYFIDVTNGDFNSCYAYFMLGGDVLCNKNDMLIDSYIFTSDAIAYYGYTDGNNTDKNTLAKSSIAERNIVHK